MKLLITTPSERELQGFSKQKNPDIDVMASGIGGFSTLYSLTKYCTEHRPDFILHAGICGSFDETLEIGEVVQVVIENFADFGAFENGKWKTGFELGLLSAHKVPFSEGELVAPPNDISIFPKVAAVTSQTITTSPQQKKILLEKFHPSIESMEGAFVHYLCIRENIPFIQLRSVSNLVGIRDKSQWDIPLALKNLHTAIEQVSEYILT